MDIMKRLSKAKTALVLEHPFFGAIALGMPSVIDDTIPTACTNGKLIRYNPDFVDGLTDGNIVFLMAHECFHPMLGHIWRLSGRDPKLWNVAGDIIINQMLVDDGIGDFIEGGLLDKKMFEEGGGTTDGVYNLLSQPKRGVGNTTGDDNTAVGMDINGGIGMDIGEAEGESAEQEQDEAEWRIKVAQAAQSAKMAGKLSVGLERLVTNILNPKVPWENVLDAFLQRCKADERTFARPNRRFIGQGMYLPSRTGEMLGEIAFFIDCSGSITDEEIAQFAAEVTKVHRDLIPTKLHVIYFDTEVSHYDVYEPNDELDIKSHGGGGTSFDKLWPFLADNDVDPIAAVVLTDLCCYDFGDQPDYPVLWVSTDETEAPFGEVVMM